MEEPKQEDIRKILNECFHELRECVKDRGKIKREPVEINSIVFHLQKLLYVFVKFDVTVKADSRKIFWELLEEWSPRIRSLTLSCLARIKFRDDFELRKQEEKMILKKFVSEICIGPKLYFIEYFIFHCVSVAKCAVIETASKENDERIHKLAEEFLDICIAMEGTKDVL